jgi:hypothetical protein
MRLVSSCPAPTYFEIRKCACILSSRALQKLTTTPTDVNNATIAAYMKDWFISFVTDLDPNAKSFSNNTTNEKPFWPLYNAQLGTEGDVPEFAVMDVNYTQIGVIPDLDVSGKCDFWHGQSYVARN